MCRNKGIDVLFEAAQILQCMGLDYELLGVFCSGREAGSLSSSTIGPGEHIVHFGHVNHDEILQLYQSSDLLFFRPSSKAHRVVCGKLSHAVFHAYFLIPGNRGVDPREDFVRFVDEWNGRRGLWPLKRPSRSRWRRAVDARGEVDNIWRPITVLKLSPKDGLHSISSYFANDFGQGLTGHRVKVDVGTG